eukprot:TRINITY_DN2823_c3_g1_i2.p1 TRINITY_DN2823_c3_g1~~TRINITY_DN2823_c3_g1_i2.p1  ORF type:complete len:1278 (+),score=339.54 TRINITY_DN2823_c3_g1_i2:89-3922(+)
MSKTPAQKRLQEAAGSWAFVNEEATLVWSLSGRAEGASLWSILSPTLLLGYKQHNSIMPAEYIKVVDMERVLPVGDTGIKIDITGKGRLALSCPDKETRERWNTALHAAVRGSKPQIEPPQTSQTRLVDKVLAELGRAGSRSGSTQPPEPSPRPPPAPFTQNLDDPMTVEELRRQQEEEEAKRQREKDKIREEAEVEKLRMERLKAEEELRKRRRDEAEEAFQRRQKQQEEEEENFRQRQERFREEELARRKTAEEERLKQIEEEEQRRVEQEEQSRNKRQDEERERWRLREEEDRARREEEEEKRKEQETLWAERRAAEEQRLLEEERKRQEEREAVLAQEERIKGEKQKLQEELERRQREWETERDNEEKKLSEAKQRREEEESERSILWEEELAMVRRRREEEELLQKQASERRLRMEEELNSQKESMKQFELESQKKKKQAEEETRQWEQRRQEEEEWLRLRHQNRADEREAWEREKRLAREEEAKWEEERREERRKMEQARRAKEEEEALWRKQMEEEANRSTERRLFEEQLRRDQERTQMEEEVRAQAEEEERARRKQEESHRKGEEMRRKAENETRRRAAEEAARRATVMADQLQQALNKAEALRAAQSSRRERSVDQMMHDTPLFSKTAQRTKSPPPPDSICESLPSVPSVLTVQDNVSRPRVVPKPQPQPPLVHTPQRTPTRYDAPVAVSAPVSAAPVVVPVPAPVPSVASTISAHVLRSPRVSTAPAHQPPVLRLSVPPPFTCVSGLYHMQRERVNGWPSWGNEGRRLYATSHGYWTVVDDPLDVVKDTGVLQSSVPHYGRPPHDLEWDSACDGKWKKDNRVVITEVKEDRVTSPPPPLPSLPAAPVRLEPVVPVVETKPLVSLSPQAPVSLSPQANPQIPVQLAQTKVPTVSWPPPRRRPANSVQLMSVGQKKEEEEKPVPESVQPAPLSSGPPVMQASYVPYNGVASVGPAKVPRSSYPLLEEMERNGPCWDRTGVQHAVATKEVARATVAQQTETATSDPPSVRYDPVQQLSPGVSVGSYRPSENQTPVGSDERRTPVWEKDVKTPRASYKRTLTPTVEASREDWPVSGPRSASGGSEFSYGNSTKLRAPRELLVSNPAAKEKEGEREHHTSYNPNFVTRTAEENKQLWEDARKMVMQGEVFRRHSVSSGAVLERHLFLSHDCQWILWTPASLRSGSPQNHSQAGSVPVRSVTKVVIGIAPEIATQPVVRYMLSRSLDPLSVFCIIGRAKVLVLEAQNPKECEKWANIWNFYLFNILNMNCGAP